MDTSQLNFESMTAPFPVWDTWDIADGALELIEAGPWLAHLPFGDPRLDLGDPFIHFMQEAWRTLGPGGMLVCRVPYAFASGDVGVGHPLQPRIFTYYTFACFGRPPQYAEDETWDWAGAGGHDFGTRFEIRRQAEDRHLLVVTMEKP